MNIATWNLDHCRASTVWPDLAREFSVDLLFLQECPDPQKAGAAWRATPRNWGNTRPWGSAVIPSAGRIEPVDIDNFAGWVTGGTLVDSGFNHNGRTLVALSVHAPTSSGTEPRDTFVREVRQLISWIAQKWPAESTDVILAGDFNFKSLGARQTGESLETTDEEKKALQEIAALGLVSCWVTAHADSHLPQTLRWKRDPTIPYHCDGILIPAAWPARVSCEVITSPKYADMSDHNSVIASIRGIDAT